MMTPRTVTTTTVEVKTTTTMERVLNRIKREANPARSPASPASLARKAREAAKTALTTTHMMMMMMPRTVMTTMVTMTAGIALNIAKTTITVKNIAGTYVQATNLLLSGKARPVKARLEAARTVPASSLERSAQAHVHCIL